MFHILGSIIDRNNPALLVEHRRQRLVYLKSAASRWLTCFDPIAPLNIPGGFMPFFKHPQRATLKRRTVFLKPLRKH